MRELEFNAPALRDRWRRRLHSLFQHAIELRRRQISVGRSKGAIYRREQRGNAAAFER